MSYAGSHVASLVQISQGVVSDQTALMAFEPWRQMLSTSLLKYNPLLESCCVGAAIAFQPWQCVFSSANDCSSRSRSGCCNGF